MNKTYIMLLIGFVLLATLVALTVLQVPHAERLIDLLYAALLGLGITHLNTPSAAPAPPDRQAGFALPGFLLVLVLGALLLTGCAAPPQTETTAQRTQVSYTQACAAYGGAFASALALRRAGKLNRSQIDQVTLLDSQITPICTGPLPVDPGVAAQQVTAAVTTLAILEVAQKASH